MRGSVEPSEYKYVVLSLFFLKYASDKFEEQWAKIVADGMEKFVENITFYANGNVFYLPEENRWSYVMENAKQDKGLIDYSDEEVNIAYKTLLIFVAYVIQMNESISIDS